MKEVPLHGKATLGYKNWHLLFVTGCGEYRVRRCRLLAKSLGCPAKDFLDFKPFVFRSILLFGWNYPAQFTPLARL
ncbi:MAG: hypothetical protein WA485_04985 [Candidatus Sulfotelmatobacter sp.]